MTVAIETRTVGGASKATELLEWYAVSADDLERVAKIGSHILDDLPSHIDRFYEWLEAQPFFREFFSDSDSVDRVKKLQERYWRSFFSGRVDEEYLAQRRVVGETHARIGLPPRAYLAATNIAWDIFGEAVAKSDFPKRESPAAISSMTRLMHLDSAIVIEEFSNVTSDLISQQSKALMEMSTPVTAIWGDILMLPIVGIIDSKRSMDIMNAMLSKISEARAKVIILDISGVAVVDTAVANHLIKITKATRLMGCECTISGVSPAIAQTIVELGIDVGTINTTATLRDALENAFQATGVVLRQAT